VLEVDERAFGPEAIAQFVAREQLARVFEHQRQQRERLLLQPEPDAVLAKLGGAGVNLKPTESKVRHRPSMRRPSTGCRVQSRIGPVRAAATQALQQITKSQITKSPNELAGYQHSTSCLSPRH